MKKVLLIMTDFYGYCNELIAELQNQGWDVNWLLDNVHLNNFERVYSKINKNYKKKKFDKYFKKSIYDINDRLDLIIIIFGANYLEKKHIGLLKSKYKETTIVYYAWDSVNNFPKIKELFMCCDKSFSFDKDDSVNYNVEFLPLFYTQKRNNIVEKKYDISTIMTFYIEKSDNLINIFKTLPNNKKKYIYLKVRDNFYLNMIKLKNNKVYKLFKSNFSLKTLTREETLSTFEKSYAVIDCPLPGQKGLTMRTFETLALNRKLITTNFEISKYDFYTPNNIYIVKNGNQKIPLSFFETPFDELYSLSEKYSIKSFVERITLIK